VKTPDWVRRAEASGEAIAERLSSKPRSKAAIEAGLNEFEAGLFMAFVENDAPDPEKLTATAMTLARRRLRMLH
jgi:hypothetical protein